MDASTVLGVPPLRSALLDDLPDGDAEEGRGARRGSASGRARCLVTQAPLRRALDPDDELDPDEIDDPDEDDWDDEEEGDEDEEPEWQLGGGVSRDCTPGFLAGS